MYLVRVLGDMPTSLPDHIDSTDISLYAPDPFRDGELGISDSRDGYVVGGRWRTKWMEKNKYRKEITYTPVQRDPKKNCLKWGTLLATIPLIAAIPIHTGYLYCILPPLIVTYVEFSTSKAGFRGRPLGTFLLLAIAAVLGSTSQLIGHIYLHLPETVVALFLFICLFILFEWWGKFFAPAGAIALVPDDHFSPRADRVSIASNDRCCPAHLHRHGSFFKMLQMA